MFEHFVKHVKSYAVKLPIGYPSLVTGILLAQKKDLLHTDEAIRKIPSQLSFNYKVFEGKHACDLVKTSSIRVDEHMKVENLSESVKSDLLKALHEEGLSQRLFRLLLAEKLFVRISSRS